MSVLATLSWPLAAARCSGVISSSLLGDTSTPDSINKFTICLKPFLAARCRGVLSLRSNCSTRSLLSEVRNEEYQKQIFTLVLSKYHQTGYVNRLDELKQCQTCLFFRYFNTVKLLVWKRNWQGHENSCGVNLKFLLLAPSSNQNNSTCIC